MSDSLGRSGDGIRAGRVNRAAPVVGLAASTAGKRALLALRREPADARFHAHTAERYVELLGRSKGALMKAGQMLSFMSGTPAVAPEYQPIYRAALGRLRGDAPPMAPQLARDVLERELGRRAESAFAEFDWEPLAAASIGQVHAARLHDGRSVAVKIQYPGVAAAIDADLKNTELLATLLSLLGGLLAWRMSADLRGMARELSVRIAEELDYRLEAANQAEFAEHYRGHPFIHVPEVVDELCTRRVLTQELVRGLRWSEALTAEQNLRDRWSEAIYRFVYGSFHRFGVFNADPHPGNYLLHEDGRVSFLDFGCVKRFRRDQIGVCEELMRASCLRDDVLGTWHAGVELGVWRSCDPVTPEDAFTLWRSLWEPLWAEQPFTLTPECAARGIEHRWLSGPSANALQRITPWPEYAIMPRIEIGVLSALSQLYPTNHFRSFAAEQLEDAAPLTEMGKLDQAFFAGHTHSRA